MLQYTGKSSRQICMCTPEWLKDDPIHNSKPVEFSCSILCFSAAMRGDIVPDGHFQPQNCNFLDQILSRLRH